MAKNRRQYIEEVQRLYETRGDRGWEDQRQYKEEEQTVHETSGYIIWRIGDNTERKGRG